MSASVPLLPGFQYYLSLYLITDIEWLGALNFREQISTLKFFKVLYNFLKKLHDLHNNYRTQKILDLIQTCE